jgi:hypothetical protein
MSTQYRLVQSGKTASGGCSAGQGSPEPVAPRIYFILSRTVVLPVVLYGLDTHSFSLMDIGLELLKSKSATTSHGGA